MLIGFEQKMKINKMNKNILKKYLGSANFTGNATFFRPKFEIKFQKLVYSVARQNFNLLITGSFN